MSTYCIINFNSIPFDQTYSGDFFRDRRHGEGNYTWPDNSSYTGTFYTDKKEGYGCFTFANSDKFEVLFLLLRLGPWSWGARLDSNPHLTIMWVRCHCLAKAAKSLINFQDQFITLFYKTGRISLNYGPILKIQNLGYSAERPRHVTLGNSVAREVASRDDVTRARAWFSAWSLLRHMFDPCCVTFWHVCCVTWSDRVAQLLRHNLVSKKNVNSWRPETWVSMNFNSSCAKTQNLVLLWLKLLHGENHFRSFSQWFPII